MSRRRLALWATLIVGSVILTGCRNHVLKTEARMSMSEPMAVTLPLSRGEITATPVGPCRPGCAVVAIIDVDGALVDAVQPGLTGLEANPVALFDEKLTVVAAMPNVRAVVLRIHSPGGGVTASELMYERLLKFREQTHVPVVACLLDVGAGGAYLLATAADSIVAHPTSITGGIGVVVNLFNLRETMATMNVLDQTLKSGDLIDVGTTRTALPEKSKALLQSMADEYHARFNAAVMRARPSVNEKEFDGRVMTGRQAHAVGLVDQLGNLDLALADAAQRGNCPGAGVVRIQSAGSPAHSPYAITPTFPMSLDLLPINVPGLARNRLPTRPQLPMFLYMWLPDSP